MTFLNPFVLFGLAAAAIPILIHLLNRRKLRTIEFSTLTFLKELQKNKMRKITIRQWLLLLLRTLLIIVLVLAFSRPAAKGNYGAIGSHAKTTLAIILDNTASMQLNNERGKFLVQAQAQALSIVSLMQDNDDVLFLRLSDLPNETMEAPTHDKHHVESLIQETDVQYTYRTIEDGLRLVSRLLQQSKNYNKEIYVITDGQTTTLSAGIRQTAAEERLFEPQVKIFYSALSQRQAENVGIEKVTIPPALLQAKKPFTLSAVIKNYGTAAVTNHLVGVTLANNRVVQKNISLGAGESATVEFTITPQRDGFVNCYIELEDDAFEADNRWFVSVLIPEKVRVLLVSSEAKYSRYISTALGVAGAEQSSALISLTTVVPSQVSSTSLAANDVVIFSGVRDFSEPQQRALKQFVGGGGGMIFFPALDSSSLAYNYLRQFNIAPFTVKRSLQNMFSTFDKVDLDFPIFRGIFETSLDGKRSSLESPDITTSVAPTSMNNLQPIISLSNGAPFLWQREYRTGKIFGFAVPATTEWSNFPLKGIFVPLMYQSVLYLASQANISGTANDFPTGETIEFTSSHIKKTGNVSYSALKIVDKENNITPLRYFSKTNDDGIAQTIFTCDGVHDPGTYAAVVNRDTLALLPVNLRREESNGVLASQEELVNALQRIGIQKESITRVETDVSISELVLQSRFGIELWRYFALAAILFALAEMIIAREKKEK